MTFHPCFLSSHCCLAVRHGHREGREDGGGREAGQGKVWWLQVLTFSTTDTPLALLMCFHPRNMVCLLWRPVQKREPMWSWPFSPLQSKSDSFSNQYLLQMEALVPIKRCKRFVVATVHRWSRSRSLCTQTMIQIYFSILVWHAQTSPLTPNESNKISNWN